MGPTEARVRIFPNRETLTRAARDAVLDAGAGAVRDRGVFHLLLAGGSTPRALYAALARESIGGRADMDRWHLYWGDERFVPPDHPDSNYRMVREALLDPASFPPGRAHRIRTESGPPDAVAAAYQDELRHAPGLAAAGWPRFDLALLGVGADGHTASLFPGTSALAETERWVVANRVEALDAWRITLTLPAIVAARAVLFLVAGADKAGAVATALGGRAGERPPAGRVRPHAGTLRWFIDQTASAALSDPSGGLPGAKRRDRI